MKYRDFKKYNKRSKALNDDGRRGGVIINEIRKLSKEDGDDLCIMNAILERDGLNSLPKEPLVCSAESMTGIPYVPSDMLLGNLIERVICGDLWIVNTQILEDGYLSSLILMSEYTPIHVEYDEEGRFLTVSVSNILCAFCTLPELINTFADEEVLKKALRNIRSYGFITIDIEKRLLDEIRKVLISSEINLMSAIGIGAII